MPRGDGTGPAGMGPMTGRAAGYCAGYPMPGYMNPYGGWPYWTTPYPMAWSAGPYTGWNAYPPYPVPFWGSRRFFGFGRSRGGGRRRWCW
ncbi:DUF5320 domain-containing protein [bacterium]|nr:DUF5320 domain-containing protein [bacterium]